jgi:hypothetical protein
MGLQGVVAWNRLCAGIASISPCQLLHQRTTDKVQQQENTKRLHKQALHVTSKRDVPCAASIDFGHLLIWVP